MNIKFYALGELLIDFLPVYDDQLHNPTYTEVAGGAPANVAASLAKLGVNSHFIGKVGNDIFGKSLLKKAKEIGIATDFITTTDSGRTALAFISLDDYGERSFCFYRDNPADQFLSQEDIPTDHLTSDTILHFGSISTIANPSKSATDYALASARKNGAIISYDPNLRPALWPSEEQMIEYAKSYLELADIIKLSKSESNLLLGNSNDTTIKLLLKKAKLVVVTDGEKGATAYTHEYKIHSPAFKVTPIDTTGAGDTFYAGILYKIIESLEQGETFEELMKDQTWLKNMIEFGNASAALTTTQKGVFSALSNLEQINTFIKHQKGTDLLEIANKFVKQNSLKSSLSPYRLNYHIMAKSGWINDPNGLIHFKNRYHVFFQHHPFSPEWGPMYWGHVSSSDLVNWRHEPIALAPDQDYESGCFSGSAVDDNGVMTLLYTAHNLENDPKEIQCLARSYDGGETFPISEKKKIITSYPKECSNDFRDPKVWKYNDVWYMIVGSGKDGRGNIPLYTSKNLENWTYQGIMCEASKGEGVMWECPNYCDLGDKQVLIVSPMEMEGHKNIFILGSFDYHTLKFNKERYTEIDFGDDFYAAQIFTDQQKRTILIGWMDMWGSEMPSQVDGWAGALTIPRILSYQNDKIIQTPAPELTMLRSETLFEQTLYFKDSKFKKIGKTPVGRSVEIKGILNLEQCDNFIIDMCCNDTHTEYTRLLFDVKNNQVVLDKRLSGKGNKKQNIVSYNFNSLRIPIHIFIDNSSIEVFLNNGEVVFSNRIYPSQDNNQLVLSASTSQAVFEDLTIYKLKNIW